MSTALPGRSSGGSVYLPPRIQSHSPEARASIELPPFRVMLSEFHPELRRHVSLQFIARTTCEDDAVSSVRLRHDMIPCLRKRSRPAHWLHVPSAPVTLVVILLFSFLKCKFHGFLSLSGVHGRIRTCNLEIRSLLLFPVELRRHSLHAAACGDTFS